MRTCTCCPFHSVRPSHCPCRRNEQREASRRYVYTMPYITLIITTNITKKYHKHTHETFTVALFLTTFKKLRSSTLSKPKRQVNAFPIMSSPTHEPSRRERCCEISANSAKKQELSPKCHKINRQSLYENEDYAAEFRLGFSV